jgi:uncharacterized repeat protein (TIGR01451 family)
MKDSSRRSGRLAGIAKLAPVAVGGFLAALMIGGAATGALLTSSDAADDPPSADASPPASGPAPALALTKKGPATATTGDELAYVLTVRNTGDAAAKEVAVTDHLPAGLDLVAFDEDACNADGKLVQCSFGELAAGASASTTIRAKARAAGLVMNEAQASGLSVAPVTASAETTVADEDTEEAKDETESSDGAAEVSLVASDLPRTTITLDKTGEDTGVVGAPVDFALTVANDGGAAAEGVVVEDTIPAGTTAGGFDAARCALVTPEGGGSVLRCTVGTLAAGADDKFELTLTPSSAGALKNEATATATNADAAPASHTATIAAPSVDVTLTKSAPETATIGTPFTYTVVARNTGTAAAAGVVVTDVLPAGLRFVPTDGPCEGSGTTVTCSVGTLAAGAQSSIQIRVVATTAGPKVNTATISTTTTEGGSAANSASATTTVRETVLILDRTVSGGSSSREAQAAGAAGYAARLVSDADWRSMTTADFASYRAIVLGDRSCSSVGQVAAAADTTGIWGPAIDGNVVIDGTDPVFHGRPDWTSRATAFATAAAGKTGAYVSLSCYYDGASPGTAVPVLNAFGAFTATGVGCATGVHIVAEHPALTGITDAYLSNWGCSVHNAFDSWPADFVVLAISLNGGAAYTSTDGFRGTPYILARGEGLRVISNIEAETASAPSAPGTTRTVTARVAENDEPKPGKVVTFRVVSGPTSGKTGTATTDASGIATFTYTGTDAGTDAVEASYVDSTGRTQTSNRAFVTWDPTATTTTTTTTTSTTTTASGGGSTETTPTTTTTVTPPPLPTPPAPLLPLPLPTAPDDFNARPVLGQVFVNGQPLLGTGQLEAGDVVDTSRGTIEIRSTGGNATFYEGTFRLGVDGEFTELELVGGEFDECPTGNRRAAAAGADGKPVRRLWGKGTGRFKTKARYSSATVRGTLWLTEDQCDGSLTMTEEGVVTVYDASLRRFVQVAAGEEYFAQAPPPPRPGRFVGEPRGTILINGQAVTQDTQVRNGDIVDTSRGEFTLRTTSGEAVFTAGRFRVRQVGGRNALTTLTLVGGNFATCNATRRALAAPPKGKSKKVVRSLWGSGTGKFQTKARYSSATVRGTIWLVQDRCDGSLTVVRAGVVQVRDLTTNRLLLVRTGGRYLARAR